MATLTATDHRTTDPATWTTADIEEQQILTAIENLPDFILHMRLPDPAPTQDSAPAA